MRVRIGAVVAVQLFALASGASAQIVTGRVVDQATATPLSGVVVLLLDSADRATEQSLTNQTGEYRLAAARAGTYRVRMLRIGYRPATSHAVRLAAGLETALPDLVAGAPISLDTVRVVGRNPCRAVGDAAATFAIWEQARTVLTAVQLTGRARVVGATMVTYQRTLDPGSRRVREQHARIQTGMVTRPWTSLPVDSLRAVGYVVVDQQNATTYYAPDLDVLLSDTFVADHCFRIAPGSDARRVGIEFEPTRDRRRVSDIGGTLWLDRASSELQRLEFRYTNVSDAEQRAEAGGDMQFARLANGAWMISRWNIRMPVVEVRYVAASGYRSRARVRETHVTGIRVEGGAMALVRQGADTLWAGAPMILAGTVLDSVANTAVAGTRVSLRGTALEATTNPAGVFRIPNVLPGEYTLDVRTPLLASVGGLHSVPVSFADSAAAVTIRVPAMAHVARSLCGETAGGVLAGRVYVTGESSPTRDVKVVAEWNEVAARSESDITRGVLTRARWLESRTDGRGQYRICGVPVNTAVVLRAQTDTGASAPLELQVSAGAPLLTADLTIDQRLALNAVLSGHVLSDFNGAPIMDVEVAIPALSRNAFTNNEGGFRIGDIPPGGYQVVVRRLGWQPLRLDLEFAANQTIERRLLLSRVQILDTVAVVESFVLRDFEENRRIGLGKFITRAELEKMEGASLSTVLSGVSSLGLTRSNSGNHAWVSSSRGSRTINQRCYEIEGSSAVDRLQGKGCKCFAQVYLDGMLLNSGRENQVVPDINRISPSEIEAIEFYTGGAGTPLKYSALDSQCGVLVIHTRRFRKDP
ncbi:MAG: carboxypeptidase regulatory-like domain-containing protein [Gemmatimonadaceae bacterium]